MLDLLANPEHTAPYAAPVPQLPPQSGSETSAFPPSHKDSIREIDIYSATERMLFDLIGQIGIGYTFDSVGAWDGPRGHMFHKYDQMQQFVSGASGLRFELSVLFPWIDKIFVSSASGQVVGTKIGITELADRRSRPKTRDELKLEWVRWRICPGSASRRCGRK